ncbi:MAG: hypothetical protein HY040_07435 [Planctomycetes bacterium]|nr:hypothetical protein [Planctomycetota bacterium]
MDDPSRHAQTPPFDDNSIVTDVELQRALGQSLRKALDFGSWDENADLEKMTASVHRFVSSSVAVEQRWREIIQAEVFPKLPEFTDAPEQAGVYTVRPAHLRDAYRNSLLCGDVTAVNGSSAGHDGAAAALVAIGICLVRYDGNLQSWRTTFLRRDQAIAGGNLVDEIRSVLDSRGRRSPVGSGPGAGRDRVTYLLRRGVMAAAERKALLEKTQTRWRLGHGMPAPLELLTGSGSMALIDETLPILEQLLIDYRRWIFLLSPGSHYAFATLANALEKQQIAIFQKGKAALDDILESGHFVHGYRRKVEDFARRLGEAMVVGGLRATEHAPGQVFVAHADHALPAAVLAMADAALQPHRGFPLSLDLAAVSSKVLLGMEAFQGLVEAAYAKAGVPHLFAT